MTNDDSISVIIAFCFIVIAFVPGFLFGTLTSRGETEQKTIVYCIEQTSACKVKYDYYKLEAR